MTPALKIGQCLKGRLGTYSILQELHKDVWTALSCKKQKVIVKTAPKHRLDQERALLQHFAGIPHLRHLIDEIDQPPAIVLQYLDDNLLEASNTKSLKPVDVKFVARGVLEALKSLHAEGYVHTDIKPDNILVNYASTENNNSLETSRFSKVALADCGDAVRVDLNANPLDMAKEDGHIIGAAIFRSPEAMMNLRWGTATDIWSFGATLISLIWGHNWHIFKPDGVTFDDENYPIHVAIKQANTFGPFPASYEELVDEERMATVTLLNNHTKESGKWKPFYLAQDTELTVADRDFIVKIMRMDPRDRPSAEELLGDEWFNEV